MTYMPNRKNYNYRLNNDKRQVEANYSQINKGEMQIKKKSLLVNRQDIYVNKTLFWRLNAKECIQTKTLLFKPNCTKELLHRRYTRPYWTVKHLWVSVHDIFSLSLCYPDMEPVLYSNKSPVEYTVYLVSLQKYTWTHCILVNR